MQERRYDGTEQLTANAEMADMLRALNDPRNKSVEMHKPGSIIDTMDGGHRKKFRVEDDGSLTRVHLETLEPL
jgi:hypothetical protein